jgi:Tfp pilus assembly protein PilF
MKDEVATLNERTTVLKKAAESFDNADFEKAKTILEKYLATSPDDIEAIHVLGTAYAKSGDLIQAEKYFEQELRLNPDLPEAHFNLGIIRTQQNRLSEAKANFEATVRLDPSDAQALNDLGTIYFSQGQFEKGEELFAAALRVNPTFKEAFLNLFEILWNNQQYNQALTHAALFLQTLAINNAPTPASPTVDEPTKQTPAVEKESLTFTRKAPALIRLSDNDKIELFNEHVPANLRSKKTGMNIAVVADFNIAGQVTQLFRLINENTIHRARCIIVHEDYLSYDNDIILSRNKPNDFDTALKIIENADFYHIGRFPVPIGDLDITNYLRPNNAIVQYYGSEIRNNAGQIYNWHKTSMITGLSAWDYTMLKDAPLFYHINMMFDASRVKRAPKPNGTLKIVHPTTNRSIKKTELFIKTIERLQKDKCAIEPVLIEGKSNEECLQLKSQSHMTFDQISVGIYGVSAIESMAAGHVVFGGISNFAASYHPENPIVWVTEDNLGDKIKHFVDHRDEIAARSQAGIDWVKMHHNPETILKQHLYMYDFVRNGHRFLKNPNEQLMR